MAVITIFSGTFCHQDEVVAGISERLGYTEITKEIYEKASSKLNISKEKIEKALWGPTPFFNRFTNEREKILAELKIVVAEAIQPDSLILHGCLGHLIPRTIPHVLRVCLIANHDYRVKQMLENEGISEKEAHKKIHEDDENIFGCTSHLFEKPAYDESLYDIVIPMHNNTPEQAVDTIAEYAASDPVKTTDRSKRAAEDFILAARVNKRLVDEGEDVDVHAENGQVVLLVNKYVVRMSKYENYLKKIISDIPGIEEIDIRLGPKYKAPTINPWSNIEGPPKIMLVDDEKDFVHTLSERLKTRDLESSIAYDGEQALDMLKKDVPDVMVLDLMMPGIDGIEVLRRIKKEHPRVEVIILTGHGSDREKEMAEDLGAYAYLQKPVNIDNLAKVMREAYKKASIDNEENDSE